MAKVNRENPLHGSKVTPFKVEGPERTQPRRASFLNLWAVAPLMEVGPSRNVGGGEKRESCLQSLFPQIHIMENLSCVQIPPPFFWLHWVFVAARGLSPVVASGGYSSLQRAGFSLRWLLLWDLPQPGMEPMSSALAGGFLTTGHLLPQPLFN